MPREDVSKVDDLIVEELDSVGLVASGSNPESDILITKTAEGAGDLFLRATAPHKTATSTKPWDGGAARRALPNEAAALRRAHAWVDPDGDTDAKSSYKFPHHEKGGAANLAGVRNGLARLSSAKIPDTDKQGVRAHLAKHLRDGGGEPSDSKSLWQKFRESWFSERTAEIEKLGDELDEAFFLQGLVGDVEKQRNIAEMMEARIHTDFTMHADGLFGDGRITRDERKAASSAIGAALDAFTSKLRKVATPLFERDPFLDDAPETAKATTAQPDSRCTLDPERPAKEADVPDITLSDEAREALDDDITAYVEHLEAEVAKSKAVGDEPAKKETVYSGLPDEVVAVLKARDVERDAAVAKAEAKAEVAEKKADHEANIRISKEFVEKAAELNHIGKAEDLGPVLQEIAKATSEDTVEKLEGYLRAANAIIDTGEFFKEFGRTGGAIVEGSALATIESQASELRKSDPDLSEDQAKARVMKGDPKLAQRADAEERERVARS